MSYTLQQFDYCQYFSTTNRYPSKPIKVNSTTIPNPNCLLATLMSVDEGEGRDSELQSNVQDYSGIDEVSR